MGFTLCRIFGLDYRAAARAGLLHDLYLQKWEETDVGRFRRLVIHPQLALENARAFGLSPMEEDIIGKHMWPLTAPLPYYKESYMVSLADKICATLEMAHLYGLLGVRRNSRACRPAAAPGRAVKRPREALAAGRQRGLLIRDCEKVRFSVPVDSQQNNGKYFKILYCKIIDLG